MNLETEDTGVIYTGGRDWIVSRRLGVRYNYFHDMLGYGRGATASGSRRTSPGASTWTTTPAAWT